MELKTLSSEMMCDKLPELSERLVEISALEIMSLDTVFETVAGVTRWTIFEDPAIAEAESPLATASLLLASSKAMAGWLGKR